MAFDPNYIAKLSANVPAFGIGAPGVPTPHIPVIWGYATTSDAVATVSAASYFNPFASYNAPALVNSLSVGDIINAYCTDGVVILEVTAIGASVTTAALSV